MEIGVDVHRGFEEYIIEVKGFNFTLKRLLILFLKLHNTLYFLT